VRTERDGPCGSVLGEKDTVLIGDDEFSVKPLLDFDSCPGIAGPMGVGQ
jgi:hypothetical protein